MQEVLNKLEVHDVSIKDLQDTTKKLSTDIDDSIRYYDKRFEKGTKRMDNIENQIKSLSDLVVKGDENRKRNHKQVMDKLDSEKEKNLLEKLKERDLEFSKLQKEVTERKKKRDQRIWEVLKEIGYVAIALFLSSQGINNVTF